MRKVSLELFSCLFCQGPESTSPYLVAQLASERLVWSAVVWRSGTEFLIYSLEEGDVLNPKPPNPNHQIWGVT